MVSCNNNITISIFIFTSYSISYNCFVLWYMSGSKAPLACVWHEGERFYTAGFVPEQCKCYSWWKALGLHAVKLKQFHHADSHYLPCILTLYKHTFDTTDQLATPWSSLCIANGRCMALQHSSARLSWNIV